MSDQDSKLDGIIQDLSGSSDFDWGTAELDEESEASLDVVRLTVAGSAFAVDGESVREILGNVELTPVPGAPAHIEGIAVFRRQVLGVFNLAAWLGIELVDRADVESQRIVVFEVGGLTAGIIADSVDGIEAWPEAVDAASVPDSLPVSVRKYAQAARWAPGGVLVLLDVARILQDAAVR